MRLPKIGPGRLRSTLIGALLGLALALRASLGGRRRPPNWEPELFPIVIIAGAFFGFAWNALRPLRQKSTAALFLVWAATGAILGVPMVLIELGMSLANHREAMSLFDAISVLAAGSAFGLSIGLMEYKVRREDRAGG